MNKKIDIRELRILVERGVSDGTIAQILGVKVKTVGDVRRANGMIGKPGFTCQPKADRLESLVKVSPLKALEGVRFEDDPRASGGRSRMAFEPVKAMR
jgi:hypothetical protein